MGLAVAGALIAGAFGVIHDQLTYTISPEYFTRMKFEQFAVWDFGLSRRAFVAEIGFLATWWVGLIAAWFLARVAATRFRRPVRAVLSAMAGLVAWVVVLGIAAYFTGPWVFGGRMEWDETLRLMHVADRVAFNRVAAIHLAGYLGALTGWMVAMWNFLKRPKLVAAAEG